MKQSMKKVLLCVFAAVMILLAGAGTVWAGSTVEVDILGEMGQTEARSMLKMINDFRTGDEAWVWNPDNTTKTVYQDLRPLVYDYELEQAAMLRAMEIAVYYGHVRPNGTTCFTAYDGYAMGENIAIGYTSAASVFEGWKETSENYSGQGHRRNMLDSGYTAVGIGHVYYNGYHCWVQEFRYPASSAGVTEPLDGPAIGQLEILSSNITGAELRSNTRSVSVQTGGFAEFPAVTARFQTNGNWTGGWLPAAGPIRWDVEDDSVIALENDRIRGLKEGTTTLSAHFLNRTVSFTVNVNDTSETTPPERPSIETAVPRIKKTAVSYNAARLMWDEIEGADGYAVYTADASNGKFIRKEAGSSNICTVKGLKPGRTYYIKVRAYQKENGKYIYSKYSEVKEIRPVLPSPAVTSLKKAGTDRVQISWKKSTGAGGYEIYYSPVKNGSYRKVGTVNNKINTFIHRDAKLKKGAGAFYKIQAYRVVDNKKIYSAFSPIKGGKLKK